MWETPISFTFLLHHLLDPRCWSYPCDWSCIMPMSILKPAWKEKEQKWRASYFLLSKFHLQSHSITEELVSWQHALQGRLGSLISTWLAHTLLKLHYQGKWEKWSWAQLATCQRWKREFVGSCNQKNSGLQVQFDPGFQTVSPNLSLSLSLSISQTWFLCIDFQFSSIQFSHSVMSNSLQPHGLQHARLPCPSPTPRACSNDWLYAQTSLDLELQRLHLPRPTSSGKYLSHYLLTLKSQDSFHLVWLTIRPPWLSHCGQRTPTGCLLGEMSQNSQSLLK